MHHGHTLLNRRVVTTLLLALTLTQGARAASDGSISVQWDPNTEPDVQGYRVYIGTQSGVYNSSVDIGNTTTFVYDGAAGGQRYCFAVAAYSEGPVVGSRSTEVCSDTSGNEPPTLKNPGSQTGEVGVATTLQLLGADPESRPVTYSATGLPTGITLNTNTGFLSGIPTNVGTFSVQATVSDGSLSRTQAFTWTISAALPGVARLLRPTGTVASNTPSFEWESVATATSYRLWVDDASATDPKLELNYTPAQAGCSTAGAVCQVAPGIALAAGRASWSIRVSNASGAGPWSGAMDFTVSDNAGPVVAISTPTAKSFYSTTSGTLTLRGTASDDQAVTQVTWTNDRGGSGAASGTSKWATGPITLLGGVNILTITARDASGNVATDVITVTRPDSTAPTVSITVPVNAATHTTSQAMMNLAGTGSDDLGVTAVTWANDRGGSGTAAGTTHWSVENLPLRSGANVITVTAVDAAGNRSTATLMVTAVDEIEPAVRITEPTAGPSFSTSLEAVGLRGTASDAFGVTQVTWTNDRGGSGVAEGTATWSVNAVSLKPGANVVTVTASDQAGNTSNVKLTVFGADKAAPEVSITVPTTAATLETFAGTLALGGTASDDVGVIQVLWATDKGDSGVAVGTTSWSVPNVPLMTGVTVITVTANDAAQHSSTAVLTVTRRDAIAPTVDITAPSPLATLSTTSATIALGGTAADNVGVTQVTWSNGTGDGGTAAGTTAWSVAGVALKPGANVITVTARDAAGNVATDSLTVTRTDDAAPAVTITVPTTASTHSTKTATIALGGSASDLFGVTELRWANSRGGAGVATGTTDWSVPAVALELGANVITVTARDAAGNAASVSVTVTRTADGKLPTVAITAPTGAGSFRTNDEAVTLRGTANDDVGVSEVTWANSRGGRGVATGTSDWSIPSAALQTGANVITVTARDTAGNISAASLTITLDQEAPVVDISAPTAAGTFTTTDDVIAVAGTATDESGVAEVSWTNSQGGGGVAKGVATWSARLISVRPGVNTLTITARDKAGNTATRTLVVRVTDATAPRVQIVTPSSTSRYSSAVGVINLQGTAGDDFGPVRVTWVNDRGGSGAANGGGGQWTVLDLALQPGANVITVTATDPTGNTDTDILRVNFDSGAPTIALTSPTTATDYNSPAANVALTGVASDDVGVVRVWWSTNKGQSGVASGTTSWSIPAVPVQSGATTVVTVTARDDSGNTTSLTLSVTNTDATAPVVKVYAPTTAPTFVTADSAVTIGGTATDAGGLTQVSWTNAQGGSGVAFGTSSWSVPGIPLAPGVNVITVTASDAAGNTGIAVLTVTSGQSSSSSRAVR